MNGLKTIKLGVVAITVIVSTSAFTASTYDQTIPVKILRRDGKAKIIQLPKIHLSKAKRQRLADNAYLMMHRPRFRFRSLVQSPYPAMVKLDMNHVPVLDQGVWGTCATFAATAGVDALLALQGDAVVSQLCNLELGRTIKNPDKDGGWQGSDGDHVFKQINQYGYLPKSYQHANGCGGLKQYPVADSAKNGEAMQVTAFQKNALHGFGKQNWRPIISYVDDDTVVTPSEAQASLHKVKQALINHHRVVFGSILVLKAPNAGAVASYDNISHDAWIITPKVIDDLDNGDTAGHEMVITGYDDTACATYVDAEGLKQQRCGMLILRNSWSKAAGDQGNFYMSYDYFKTMALEAYELGKNLFDPVIPAKAGI